MKDKILNKGDVFMSSRIGYAKIDEDLWITDDYVNCTKERWYITCWNYYTKEINQIHTSQVGEIFTKEQFPEYYL